MVRKAGVRRKTEIPGSALPDPGTWEQNFWYGFRHGWNRRQFGSVFASEEEHGLWIGMPENPEEEPSMERIARGLGYRTGYSGIPFEEAVGTIRDFMKKMKRHFGMDEA
jgi:hypothetical protein